MKKFYLPFALCVLFFAARAEDYKWYRGTVFLLTGDVLKGEISRAPLETLLLRIDGKHTVLPAHKVKSYFYYDEEEGVTRKFEVYVQYFNNMPYVGFYECVVSGEWSVWRRQKIYRPVIEEKRMDAFSYFVRHNERIVPLRRFRKELYPVLASACRNNEVVLADFKKLRPNKPAHVIAMTRQANILLDLSSNAPTAPAEQVRRPRHGSRN